jgi:hypothetical protein
MLTTGIGLFLVVLGLLIFKKEIKALYEAIVSLPEHLTALQKDIQEAAKLNYHGSEQVQEILINLDRKFVKKIFFDNYGVAHDIDAKTYSYVVEGRREEEKIIFDFMADKIQIAHAVLELKDMWASIEKLKEDNKDKENPNAIYNLAQKEYIDEARVLLKNSNKDFILHLKVEAARLTLQQLLEKRVIDEQTVYNRCFIALMNVSKKYCQIPSPKVEGLE